MLKIIECSRDAMQGLHDFIPTSKKAEYINQLLKVGFDTIDFGSFVSPQAIPQLRDTAEVLDKLDLSNTRSHLLAIVANVRGAETACGFDQIRYLGFPLSLSETFQQRNTNKSIAEALIQVNEIQQMCLKRNKELVVYLSMGFGNPYGDHYTPDFVIEYTDKLKTMGIKIVSLADTIGVADEALIEGLFSRLVPAHPDLELGAHLHSNPNSAGRKAKVAYLAGCRRFDGALKGFGGCPMAKDELVGNMPTELMLETFRNMGIDLQLEDQELAKSLLMATSVFPM